VTNIFIFTPIFFTVKLRGRMNFDNALVNWGEAVWRMKGSIEEIENDLEDVLRNCANARNAVASRIRKEEERLKEERMHVPKRRSRNKNSVAATSVANHFKINIEQPESSKPKVSRPEILVAARPEILVAARPEILVAARPEILVAARPEILVATRPEILVAETPKVGSTLERKSQHKSRKHKFRKAIPLNEVETILIQDLKTDLPNLPNEIHNDKCLSIVFEENVIRVPTVDMFHERNADRFISQPWQQPPEKNTKQLKKLII